MLQRVWKIGLIIQKDVWELMIQGFRLSWLLSHQELENNFAVIGIADAIMADRARNQVAQYV
jgi:hypothetical protein